MNIPAKLIKSADKIPTAKPSDTLSLVLSHVKSSHDPVFIFDDGKFIGIVSASFSLFKKRFPLKTKAIHALKKPPKITQDTSLFTVAKHMLALDTYTLPVFGYYGDIWGVINARDLIGYLNEEGEKFNLLEKDNVITGSIRDRIRKVYKKMKNDKSSRIVLVDEKKNIRGIVTRRDIQEAFMSPPRKGKSAKTRNNRTFIIDDKDLKKFDFTLGEFMKSKVVTMMESAKNSEIIDKILFEKINSIVLTDRTGKPKKIVSVSNFLNAIAKSEPKEVVNFSLTDHQKVLIKSEVEKIKKLVDSFSNKINRSKPIKSARGEVSAYYNKKNKITGFNFHFHLNFKDGKNLNAKVEDKVLWNAVKKSMEKVRNQLKRKSNKAKTPNKI